MSGRGTEYTYMIKCDGKVAFATSPSSYFAWAKKKDDQKVIDAVSNYGLEYVEGKLGQKLFLN